MVSYRELTSFVWQFMRTQKWTFLGILLIDAFAWPLDALVMPYLLHLVIDIFAKFEADRAAAWDLLKYPVLFGIGFTVYMETASRAMGFLMAKAIPKLQTDIRLAMFDHIQYHSPHYFNERFSGSLANKITDMTTQVETFLQQLFWPLIPALSTCLLGTIVFYAINPVFALILLIWLVLHMGVCFWFSKKCDAYEHEHGEARSTLLGMIVDSLTNNFAVNLFYRFNYERKIIAPFQKIEEEANIKSRRYVEKMRLVTSVFYFALAFFGTNAALIYFWIQGEITTGQVVQVFNTMTLIAGVMWMVGSVLPTLFQSVGTMKQAYSVMQDANDLGDKPEAKELKVSSGEIIFEDVSFQYGEKKLFENKHVRIQGGEKVGLVGFTGAGKSSFINLILRFYPLKSGKILIDGQDIADVSLKSLRGNIALIPQDPVLFHRTLRENISYGNPESSESALFSAAAKAHADAFIRSTPGGYEAKVGERGTKLSGGEKQRVAIARAILGNAPILILDEATSALDSVTEGYIQDSLEKLMQGRTTIVIAHRLSTLARLDRILVFDKGKIVEEGTHADLLAKNGLYAEMWNSQVGGFLPS